MKKLITLLAIVLLFAGLADAQIILRSGGYWKLDSSGNLVPVNDRTVDIGSSNIDLDNTTYENKNGIVKKNGGRFIHDFNYGNNGTVTTNGGNLFVGSYAGNLTFGATATQVYQSSNNIGIGDISLQSLTTGYDNVALGRGALLSTTTGAANMSIGVNSMYLNVGGASNTAVGVNALFSNISGNNNVGIGSSTLYSITGSDNTGIGGGTLYYLSSGQYNVGIGRQAGQNPSNNIAQYRITTDTNAVLIGYGATKDNAAQLDNIIAIGNNAQATKSNLCVLGNASITETWLRGNVGMGVTTFGTSAATVLGIGNGTAPTTSPADMVQTWSADHGGVAGKAALHVLDEAGNTASIGNAGITVGSGTGITVNLKGHLNRQMYKVTTTYAAYSDTDTTKGIVIATLPAKMKIVGFYADTTAAYTGGAVSAATLEVGITAEGAAEILATHDVFSGAVTKGLADADMGTGMTRAAQIQGGYMPSWTGTTAIYATIDTTTANTNALTAGSTTFYIETEQF